MKKPPLTGIAALFLATGTVFAEERSPPAIRQFIQQNPPPGPRSDYIVDHKIPLSIGGTNAQDNLQWQSKPDAKAKDNVECDGHKCGRR